MDQPRKRLFPKGRVLICGLVFSMLLVGASLVVPVLPGGSRTANVAHAGGGPPTFTATINVASLATLSAARTTVLVSGTFSCSIDGGTFISGTINATLKQISSRQSVEGTGFTNFTTCTGTSTPFQITVGLAPPSAPFHGGSAVANVGLTLGFVDTFGNFIMLTAGTGDQVIHIKG